jgi:hypothetical protein
MNATEAINKIANLLGMKFKSEKFFVTKLDDNETEVTNNQEGPFTVGEMLYVVGEDSILLPAPAGSHTTREGITLTVAEDSIISKIEEEAVEEVESPINEASTDVEVETEVLSSATLTDGTKVETDEEGDFAVGQKLFVITEEGDRVSAPEGEHTTESGITLVVDSEGVLTGVKYPDEEGEGSLETDLKKMKEAMGEMLKMMQKYSADLNTMKKDYEDFKNSPVHQNPVAKKTFGKENILDAKVRFLRESIRK